MRRVLGVAAIILGVPIAGSLAGGGVANVQAAGTTRYVCHPGTTSPAGCYPTIQSAIYASNPGDTIVVPGGRYHENLDVPAANTPLTVTGSGSIVDGATSGGTIPCDEPGYFPILCVEPGATVSFSGFTFTGATGTVIGGVVNWGNLTLTSSFITGNQASDTGGIYSAPGSTLMIVNTIINKNVGGNVGGLAVDYLVPATLKNVQITGNRTGAYGVGGGVWVHNGGNIQMWNSDITYNSIGAGEGAGIFANDGGMISMTNGTIAYNTGTAGSTGGGIWHDNISPITLNKVTVAHNTVGADGGGVYDSAAEDTTCSTINTTSTTIINNSPDNCS